MAGGPPTAALPSPHPQAKLREVSLHKDSPLGETVLECYNSGSRNVFGLGFVPLTDENTGGWRVEGNGTGSPAAVAVLLLGSCCCWGCGEAGSGSARQLLPPAAAATPQTSPSASRPTVVLLARDTPPAAPGIRELNIDMSQWAPLIEDRAFVSWLVKVGQAG